MKNFIKPFKKDLILVACFPKSGSSYVSRNLAALIGYEFCFISGSIKNKPDKTILLTNEQILTYSKLLRCSRKNIVSQAHCLATDRNMGLIKYFDIKTIILVRNIFDVCVSLRDHILNDQNQKQIIAVVDNSYASLSSDRQLDFIVDFFVPWYLKFYVSWYRQSPFFVSYEDMLSDEKDFFCSLLDYCGKHQDIKFIGQKLDVNLQPKGRFNKGLAGRGSELTKSQKDRILNLLEYYPDVNFDRIIS